MSYPCPVCGSDAQTFPHPKHHKQYTERGRLDVDDWYCHGCKARWESWDYVREGVSEIKNIRVRDGRPWVDGQIIGAAITCRECASSNVKLISKDGIWRTADIQQLRYECEDCGAIWINMTHDDGRVLKWRRWRWGRVARPNGLL